MSELTTESWERELTLKELAQHDGSDPDRPLMLAIRGTVFDITPGAHSLHDPWHSMLGPETACFPLQAAMGFEI